MENNFAPAVIKALKVGAYKIELSFNLKGQPVARNYQFMTMGKNKGQYKLIEGFYFATEEKRAAWVGKKIADIKSWMKSAEDKKAAKKAARADMKHDFKVGEIYYSSWGYDQTNIDFYVIKEVKEKSVVIQEIGGSMVEGTGGSDWSYNVKPDPSKLVGKPMQKNIQVGMWGDAPRYYVKMEFGGFNFYDAGDAGVYTSSGH